MALLRKLLRTAPPETSRIREVAGATRATPKAASPSSAGVAEDAERVHALASEGRFGEALALCDELLAAIPKESSLVLARGSTLFEWGRYREALPWLERAAALGSDNFNLHLRAGWTCMWSSSAAAAEPWMRKATEVNDREWTGHFGLATSLRGQGRLDDAVAAFERALEVAPGNLHCLAQLADCMLAQKQPAAAERYARRSIAANRAVPVAWTNLGVALVAQDRLEEATAAFEHADRLAGVAGEGFDQHLNLGMCLRESGRLDEALKLYELKLPTLPAVDVNTHYAHALLTAGKLREGFEQYEFRWLHAPLLALRPSFRKPAWAGQDLRGRTILLRTEQGIGDVIQFIRYAPHVKALGATVLLQVRPGVGDLARCFPGIDRILKADEPYPEFDFYAHLMSLPRIFGTELASVPAAIPYLHAEPARRARWADRLGAASAFRVGLFWAGDANHLRDRYRSVALSALAPLAEVEGVQFYALQVGDAALQSANPPAGMRMADLGSELEDFADTAAVIDQMDLVISVDTSVAHLAGALGKPVWMLVGLPAEWRWMTEREDTPWYPTMRLFRQRRHGDWSEVITRVRDALRAQVQSRSHERGSRINTDANRTPLLPAPAKRHWFAGRSAPAETATGIVQYFPDEPIVGDSIGWYGEYLRAQTDLLASLIKPGSVVMEVGAGIGAHVLALAPAIGGAGQFFVYESRPLFQQALRQNLGANGIGNVTVMKRALRGQDWQALDNGGAEISQGSGDPVIATETIDELRVDKLDWLKIGEADVLDVLTGASETLWRLRPNIFVAIPDQGVRAIQTRLHDHGYQCWKVTTSYFNPKNFNRRDADIFSGRAAVAVLAVPEEIDATIAYDGCESL